MMNYIDLSNDQYNALCKITRKTGMDCWFKLKQDTIGKDYVFDLDANKSISWDQALEDLVSGLAKPISSLDNPYNLTINEYISFIDLLFKANVHITQDVWTVL